MKLIFISIWSVGEKVKSIPTVMHIVFDFPVATYYYANQLSHRQNLHFLYHTHLIKIEIPKRYSNFWHFWFLPRNKKKIKGRKNNNWGGDDVSLDFILFYTSLLILYISLKFKFIKKLPRLSEHSLTGWLSNKPIYLNWHDSQRHDYPNAMYCRNDNLHLPLPLHLIFKYEVRVYKFKKVARRDFTHISTCINTRTILAI